MPDFPGAEHCITSNEVFNLSEQPKRLVVQGAGYIAMEFAGVFNAIGSHVTVVNRTETILRGYDEGIVERLMHIAMMRGIDFHMHCQIAKVEKQADGSLLVHTGRGDPIHADQVLIATGRKPNTAGLGLESAGIELGEKGEIPVDEYNKTSCDSIYAVGDVTDRIQLTPVAIREGHAFADSVFGGKPRTVDYENVPSAVFSQPPLARRRADRERRRATTYGNVKVYSSDFRPMKNIFSDSPERGLYKMIVRRGFGQDPRHPPDRAGSAGDPAGRGDRAEGRADQAGLRRHGRAASVDGGGAGAASS